MKALIRHLVYSKRRSFLFALVLLAAFAVQAFGFAAPNFTKKSAPAAPEQQITEAPAPGSATPAPPQVPTDPLGRDTPRGTVLGFLGAVEASDFDRAAQFMNTSKKGDALIELANQLAYVLNNSPLRRSSVSDNADGTDQPGLSRGIERIIIVTGQDGPVPVDLSRSQQGGLWIWRFSPATLTNIPGAYEFMKDASVDKHLPAFLSKPMWLFVPLWKYLALLIGFLLAIPAANTLRLRLARLFLRFYKNLSEHESRQLVRRLSFPLMALVWLLITMIMVLAANLPLYARTQWFEVTSKIWIGVIVWLVLSVVNLSALAYRWRIDRTGTSSALAVVRLVQRTVNLVCIAIGVIVFLHLVGYDVTALVAGLGLGGVALAFAAQKTLENLFGGVMLVFDRPIRVGDQCRINGDIATVEDIGVRSTRLRSSERTIMTVPNSQFSTMVIDNLTMRDKFLFRHTVGLRTDTTTAQLEKLLKELRVIIEAEPTVDLPTCRVRLIRVDSRALFIELYSLINTREGLEFLGVQEGLLLKTMHTIDEMGIALATPIFYSASNDADAAAPIVPAS